MAARTVRAVRRPQHPPRAPTRSTPVLFKPTQSSILKRVSTALTDVNGARQQARGRVPDAPALLELPADVVVGRVARSRERINFLLATRPLTPPFTD